MRHPVSVLCILCTLAACDEFVADLEPPFPTSGATAGAPENCSVVGEVQSLGRGYDVRVTGSDIGYLVAWAEDFGQPFAIQKFTTIGQSVRPATRLLQTEDGLQFLAPSNNGFLVASSAYRAQNAGVLTKINREGDPLWTISQDRPFLAAASRRADNGTDETHLAWTTGPDENGAADYEVMVGSLGNAEVLNPGSVARDANTLYPVGMAVESDGTIVIGTTASDGNAYELSLLTAENGLVTKSPLTRGYAAVSWARLIAVFSGDYRGALWVEENGQGESSRITVLNRRAGAGTESDVNERVLAAAFAREMLAILATDEYYEVLLSFVSIYGTVEKRFLIDPRTQYFMGTPRIAAADPDHFALAWVHLLPSLETEVRLAFVECQ